MRFVWVLLVCAACGGTSEPPQRTAPALSTVATAAGPDDVVVAQVNGRPVWGSCVAAQATSGKTKAQALDECIAFELLAQEADRRGFASDPEVAFATRTALVDRVVEVAYEQRYQTPADLAAILDQHIERNKHKLDKPEQRASAYVRYTLPKDAPPTEDWKARELMEGFAAKMKDEVGLTASHLDAAAKAYFGATKVDVAVVEYFPEKGLALGYREALFAIPEPGRTSPQAVRTPWGWDVILYTDVSPAKSFTREQAAVEAFPEVRRGYFTYWVDQLAKSLGVTITRDDKAIAKLDQVGP